MAKRWTPRRFIVRRRVRVGTCALLVALAMILTFIMTARKSVALTVNGQIRNVTTYAYSLDGLLRQEGIEVKTHDLAVSSSGERLQDHAVVTVRSAFQTTININGTEVPFWTTATSMDQLLGFFEANRRNAVKVSVDVKNVYDQLTGGLVINQDGPVTVVVDGRTTVAPNGRLPVSSILDSQGVTLGREDRVSVEKDGDKTVLRVKRVTHGETSRDVGIPFSTRTVVDPTLRPGQQVIRQKGVSGVKRQTFDTTFVDGRPESERLTGEVTTTQEIDQVIAVGPDRQEDSGSSGEAPSPSPSPSATSGKTDEPSAPSGDDGSGTPSRQPDPKPSQTPQPTQPEPGKPEPSQTPEPTHPDPEKPKPKPPTPPPPAGRLWHPTREQAIAYAGGAAAQYGWTGGQFDDLIKLWDKESGWRWSAINPLNGNPETAAYGIPQSLPGRKMAAFGANWKDDGAVQIDWGLNYIAGRYGNPSAAWKYWNENNWY